MSHSLNNIEPEQEVSSICEVSGCSFYGTPATQNRCSKHFKELQKNSSQSQAPTNPGQNQTASETPTPVNTQVDPIPSATPQTSSDADVQEEIRNLQQTSIHETSPPASLCIGELAPPAAAPIEAPVLVKKARVQKSTKRCMECNKFVGLRGMKCKCGFVYCAKHRYPETHDCDFDFDKLAREKYAQNQAEAAVADKIGGERL